MDCEHKPAPQDYRETRYVTIAGAAVTGAIKVHRCRLCGASYLSEKVVRAAVKEMDAKAAQERQKGK